MNENLVAFFNKINNNDEFAEKIKACTTPEEAYALAQTIQDGFTQEEFVAAMQQIRDAMSDELDMDDLQNVAGGLEVETENKIIWGTTITSGLGIGAAISYCVAASACVV